jgi:cell division protein ZapA
VSRSPSTVSVTILGKEYQVACPADQQAELLLSARHLDEQMRSIKSTGKVIGLERIAVMAALNISHELLQARNGVAAAKGHSADSGHAGARGKTTPGAADDPAGLASLNSKLDEALHHLRQLEMG